MHNKGKINNPSGGSFANIKSNSKGSKWAGGTDLSDPCNVWSHSRLCIGVSDISCKSKTSQRTLCIQTHCIGMDKSFFRTWKSCFPLCYKHQYSGPISPVAQSASINMTARAPFGANNTAVHNFLTFLTFVITSIQHQVSI